MDDSRKILTVAVVQSFLVLRGGTTPTKIQEITFSQSLSIIHASRVIGMGSIREWYETNWPQPSGMLLLCCRHIIVESLIVMIIVKLGNGDQSVFSFPLPATSHFSTPFFLGNVRTLPNPTSQKSLSNHIIGVGYISSRSSII